MRRLPSRRRSTATVEFGRSGGPRSSDGLLLALSFPSGLRPPPARFCPPQQARFCSPLRASLPSIFVRVVSLAKKNAGADAPNEAGMGLFASVEWCSDGLTFAFFWCRCRWFTFTKTHSLRHYGYEVEVGVLGSLIANCTVLSLSLALPPWAAPASVPLLPASAGPLLPTSSRLPAFYFCAVCVLGKKILALTRQVKLGGAVC